MEITKRFEQETDKAWQKFKAGEGKYYEGYADAFGIAEQIYKEEVELNEKKWERMTNPYGAMEGFYVLVDIAQMSLGIIAQNVVQECMEVRKNEN